MKTIAKTQVKTQAKTQVGIKIKITALIFCLLIPFAFTACGGQNEAPGQSILSQDIANIAEITVYFDGQGKNPVTLNPQEGEDLIKALGNTKGEETSVGGEGEQWGSFKYALDIHYADGGIDQIFSDEEGLVFFRFINGDTSQLRGEDSKLADILEGL